MSLPNQEVFILFHPLIYMAKLNIEMTMASLIVKLARTGRADAYQHHRDEGHHSTTPRRPGVVSHNATGMGQRGGDLQGNNDRERDVALKTFTESRVQASYARKSEADDGVAGGGGGGGRRGSQIGQPTHGGIQRTREFQVTVHHSSSGSTDEDAKESINVDDDAWLTSYPGHPNGTAR